MPLSRFFEVATIAGQALELKSRETSPGRVQKIAQAVLRIKQMPEDEKRRLLANHK
jgi:hypothetical protein